MFLRQTPPSLRAFYRELGAIRWGPAEETLALAQVPERARALTVLLEHMPKVSTLCGSKSMLIPLYTVDGNYGFVLRSVRDAGNESPTYFVYHDEDHAYGGEVDMFAWLRARFEHVMDAAMA